MEPAAPSPFSLPPPRGSRVGGDVAARPAGTADLPSAVPVSGASRDAVAGLPRRALIAALRQSIEKIERPVLAQAGGAGPFPGQPPVSAAGAAGMAWSLGEAGEHALIAQPLETNGLHEVKPLRPGKGASAGDWMASLGFALRLGVRRLRQADCAARGGLVLWCWPRVLAGELGRPSWHGLKALGLDPARLLIVETARAADALGALEEGLKSPGVVFALGVLEDVGLNPSRRLSLAAGAHGVPCLLATHPSRPPAAATATRWRIARAASASHPFDARAPGSPRFTIALERCRAFPMSVGSPPLVLEWSDETHAFRMAARLADRASFPRRAGRGAGA